MNARMKLPPAWEAVLADSVDTLGFAALAAFLESEREGDVFPAEAHVFAAFEATPFEAVRVVLLGQDPYPTKGHAHGLCFSVLPGVKPPRSLANIYKELRDDLGHPIPTSGHLMPWARQGVLMLNTVLTVRAGEPGSHKGKGWESFTDRVITRVNERDEHVVFVLWGGHAQKKRSLVDERRHTVVAGAHPSPLSAKRWFGSRPFSKINAALAGHGQPAIDWQLRDA
jgi:uracil-DNA glycosylase